MSTQDSRKNDAEIMEQLAKLTTLIETHIAEEQSLRPKLEELITILERSKGVVFFFKLLIYIGAPLAALIAWSKDHIKF